MEINYEFILRRSFEISRKHKWLWIFALFVGGGGSTSGIRAFFNSIPDLQDVPETQEIPIKTAHVLGEHTSLFTEWLSSVSVFTWIAIAIVFIICIVLSIIVSLILKNWAKGALISGIDKALNGDEKIDLKNTSPEGIRSVNHLIILSLINTGFSILLFVVLPAVGILVYYVIRSVEILGILWIILASIGGALMLIIGILLLSMTGVYAERLITLHNVPPWKAWKKGLNLSKGNFLRTLLMGILNIITSTLLGCVTLIIAMLVLGIPTFALVYPSIRSQSFPHPVVIIILIFIILIFILFNMLVQAFVAVFKYSNWNQLFNIIIAYTENGNRQ